MPPSQSAVVRGVGISVADATPRQRMRFHLGSAQGVLVIDVDHGSVGQLAGLRRGDLITRVNGTRVRNAQALQQLVAALPSGALVRLNIRRQRRHIFVVLTKA